MKRIVQSPQEAAKTLYNEISNFVNGNRHYIGLVAEQLTYDHKLLQTYIIDLFIACIEKMANTDKHCITIQNMDAIEKCKKMIAAIS